MPSLKRMRVEAPDQSATPGLSELIDEFDDIYDIPSKDEKDTSGGIPLPAPAKVNTLSTASQTPTFLPGLSGLGNFHNDAEPPDGPALSQTHQNPQTVPQESAPVPESADEMISKAKLLEEADSREVHENVVMGVLDEVSNGRQQTLTAKESGRSGKEQESRERIPSTREEGLKDLANKPISELVESFSVEEAIEANMQREGGEDVQVPDEGLPRSTSFQSAKVEVSFEDPLAFLEASLPQVTSREAEPNTLRLEPQRNETREESKRMVEAPTFDHLTTANKENVDAEFELDSSPLNSDSDSSDDSSSSNDDDADDYEMLDPEEQARRLMAEDGGSDDEGGGKAKTSGPLRTQNEKPDEDVPKPDVVVTEGMKIEELGSVEGTVENLVLIKAKTSGEYQVLEQGSVLCLEDRSVIGAIAETWGRVQQPYYTVRFTNAAAIVEAGIANDTRIFYVEQHSTPVFTQSLKVFKGSDASNLHDEEVGDDELEFSDDEAEAEHKRRVKMQRQQKRMGRDGQSDGFSRGPRGGRGGFSRGEGRRDRYLHMENGFGGTPELQEQAPNHAEAALNYDDIGNAMSVDGDELYTPLARPTNLHEMTDPRNVPTENPGQQWGSDRGGHGRGRGREDRGGGRGFGRGRGRGGFGNRGGHTHHHQPSNSQQSSPNALPPRPPQQGNSFTPAPPSAQQYPSTPYTAAMPNQQLPYPSFNAQYPPQWYQQHAFQYPQQQAYNNSSNNNNNKTTYQHPPQNQAQNQAQPFAQPYLAPSPSNNSIPPGAHINPAFFRQQQQQWPQ